MSRAIAGAAANQINLKTAMALGLSVPQTLLDWFAARQLWSLWVKLSHEGHVASGAEGQE